MEILSLLLGTIIIILASLIGVLFLGVRAKRWTEANSNYLIAFSAGVFLVVSYNLVYEALEFGTNVLFVALSVLIGFFAFYLFEKLYPEVHCHHDDALCQTDKTKKGARKVLLGDALHNIGDGLLLGPIFLIDIRLGFMAAFGIFVHECVQEISEFFILKSAGYTTKQALLTNVAIATTIIPGALAGYYLATIDGVIGVLIGLAAGAFIHILFVDLIPQSIKNSHTEKKYKTYVTWGVVGVLLIVGVNYVMGEVLESQGLGGHGHLEHGSDHHEDDHDEHEHEHLD